MCSWSIFCSAGLPAKIVDLTQSFSQTVSSRLCQSLSVVLRCTSGTRQFMYLVFTRMSGESYCRRLRSLLLLYLCNVFRVLIKSACVLFLSLSVSLSVCLSVCLSLTRAHIPFLSLSSILFLKSFVSLSPIYTSCLFPPFVSHAHTNSVFSLSPSVSL